MDQVRRGTSNTIRATFRDGDTVVNVVSATLEVSASDGTILVTAGTTATADGDGWSHVLGPVADCDILTALWTGIDGSSNTWTETTTIEVVGGFYFELDDLAQMPDIRDNTNVYGPTQLGKARRWIEALIERVCRTSFVERFNEDVLPANPLGVYVNDPYPRRLLGLQLDDHTVTPDDLAVLVFQRDKIVPGTGRSWPASAIVLWSTSTIRYVAGYQAEPPEDLRIAALTAARQRLLAVDGASGIPDRATSMTNQFGNILLATADAHDHPTAIDAVDSVICAWRDTLRTPGIA